MEDQGAAEFQPQEERELEAATFFLPFSSTPLLKEQGFPLLTSLFLSYNIDPFLTAGHPQLKYEQMHIVLVFYLYFWRFTVSQETLIIFLKQ